MKTLEALLTVRLFERVSSPRSICSGLVTATFAASLITSPAIGAHLARLYSENFVIALGMSFLRR